MPKQLKICVTILVWLCLWNAPSIANQAGEIEDVAGEVSIRNTKAQTNSAEIGDALYIGDLVKTRKDSQVTIKLRDDAVFQIAHSSNFIIDDFIVSETNRSLSARMIKGALHYVSAQNSYAKDTRSLFLANAELSIRGTNFIAEVGPRIQVVLLSGNVEISTRSNTIKLDRRGHTVFLDRSGRFDEAYILPDADIEVLGNKLGWDINLPPRPKTLPFLLVNPVRCALINGLLVCG